MNKKDIN